MPPPSRVYSDSTLLRAGDEGLLGAGDMDVLERLALCLPNIGDFWMGNAWGSSSIQFSSSRCGLIGLDRSLRKGRAVSSIVL